jgi:hypothetical protein
VSRESRELTTGSIRATEIPEVRHKAPRGWEEVHKTDDEGRSITSKGHERWYRRDDENKDLAFQAWEDLHWTGGEVQKKCYEKRGRGRHGGKGVLHIDM